MTAQAAHTAANTWPIIASVAGLFAGLVGALVVLNLQSLKASITKLADQQRSDIARIETTQKIHGEEIRQLSERRQLCQQDFVGKVEYIRSANTIEESVKELTKSVAELNGSMKVIERMPQICGAIARDIVKEMQHG